MNFVEYGKCDVCGKEGTLKRKYYYYDIKCDCCLNGGKREHFEIVRYCEKCKPTPPYEITVKYYGDRFLKEVE